MKKLICICLSVILAFSAVSAVVYAASAVLLGDVTSDEKVDMKDMLLMKNRIEKVVGNSSINFTNSDVNADGKINELDAQMIRAHLSKEKEFGDVNVYSMDGIADCMNLYGRAVLSGSSVLLSQTASGIEFIADCEGDIQLSLTTATSGKLSITVDDDYENIKTIDVKSTKAKYTFGLELEKGKHRILIQKATEWSLNSLYTINSVTLVGSVVDENPEAKPYKIEFYGDSITSGYGNLTTNGTSSAGNWNYQNGCQTYATYVAQALNADYAIASASGHGVLGGYSGYTQTYDKYFDYSVVSDKTAWSRKDYDADLIVINFGSNDNSREGNNLDVDAFVAKSSEIIEGMHKDNADAQILWVIGMNYVSSSAPVITALKQLEEKYDYVTFYKSVNRQSGGEAHPSVADHKVLAGYLTDYIKSTYTSIFGAEESSSVASE